MRHRQIDRQLRTTPQLEQLDPRLGGKPFGLADQSDDARVSAERTAVVHERHRDEIVPEDQTSDAHEWKHRDQLTVRVARGEIQTFVAKHALGNRSPAMQVEMCPSWLRSNERVPL